MEGVDSNLPSPTAPIHLKSIPKIIKNVLLTWKEYSLVRISYSYVAVREKGEGTMTWGERMRIFFSGFG